MSRMRLGVLTAAGAVLSILGGGCAPAAYTDAVVIVVSDNEHHVHHGPATNHDHGWYDENMPIQVETPANGSPEVMRRTTSDRDADATAGRTGRTDSVPAVVKVREGTRATRPAQANPAQGEAASGTRTDGRTARGETARKVLPTTR